MNFFTILAKFKLGGLELDGLDLAREERSDGLDDLTTSAREEEVFAVTADLSLSSVDEDGSEK